MHTHARAHVWLRAGGGFSFGQALVFAEFNALLLRALGGLGLRARIFSLEYPLT